jgi:hypothetical protein
MTLWHVNGQFGLIRKMVTGRIHGAIPAVKDSRCAQIE